MTRRVVVTGMGIVSSLGNTVSETWDGLLAGRSGAAPIRRFDPSTLDVRFGCEIPDDAAEKIVTVKDAVNFIESHS